MERDFMTIANSPLLWLCAAIPVLIVIWQGIIYVTSSLKAGKELGMGKEQLNAAIKSTAIAGIGPGLANVAGVVTLATAIGAPIAWMRLSIIGAVSYEMLAANIGAQVMGVDLGGVGYGVQAFATSIWAMSLGTTIYVLFPCLFANKFGKLFDVVVKGNKAKMGVLAAGCSIGVFSYLVSAYPVTGVKTGAWGNFASAIGGGIIYVIMNMLKAKTGKRWIGEWALTFAMFGGLLFALIINSILGV